MKPQITYRITVILLIVLPSISVLFRSSRLKTSYDSFVAHKIYKVKYQFHANPQNEKNAFIKSFIPKDNERQRIVEERNEQGGFHFLLKEDENKLMEWHADSLRDFSKIEYSFLFKGRAIQYNMGDALPIIQKNIPEKYLSPEEFIESDNPKIKELANHLVAGKQDMKSVLKAFFDYCYQVNTIPIGNVISAMKTLETNNASCNGKSRLFVALCRSIGIGSRTVGGMILDNSDKRTSHLWAEVFIEDNWVPFDALNGYFAELPANFMEIYRGDHYLVSRSKNLDFNYNYSIREISNNIYINAIYHSDFVNVSPIWSLIDEKIIPFNFLIILLLFPLCGLIVAIFKNVIGLKTFGAFLPILIAFSLMQSGYWGGLLLFVVTISLIGLLTYVLDLWGILYTPKLSIVLGFTIIWILFCTLIGVKYEIPMLMNFTFFPIIVLALVSQQFTRVIVEDGYKDSFKILGQTVFITTVCYFIITAELIEAFFIIFPEMIMTVLGINLLLGKWIGLRLSEYKRFKFLAT